MMTVTGAAALLVKANVLGPWLPIQTPPLGAFAFVPIPAIPIADIWLQCEAVRPATGLSQEKPRFSSVLALNYHIRKDIKEEICYDTNPGTEGAASAKESKLIPAIILEL